MPTNLTVSADKIRPHSELGKYDLEAEQDHLLDRVIEQRANSSNYRAPKQNGPYSTSFLIKTCRSFCATLHGFMKRHHIYIWPICIGCALILTACLLHYLRDMPGGVVYAGRGTGQGECFNASEVVINSVPVFFCKYSSTGGGGTQCGTPAADAFCQTMSYTNALNFSKMDTGDVTIAIGDDSLAGHLGFEYICCEEVSTASTRWLLLLGGLSLLFPISSAVAAVLLAGLERSLVALADGAEILHFLIGLQGPTEWLLRLAGSVVWCEVSLWVVWCNSGTDLSNSRCSAPQRNSSEEKVSRILDCLLLFAAARFVSVAVARAISATVFLKNMRGSIRSVMQCEMLLEALLHPQNLPSVPLQSVQSVPLSPMPSSPLTPGHSQQGAQGASHPMHPSHPDPGLGPLKLGSMVSSAAFDTFLEKHATMSDADLAKEIEETGLQLLSILVRYMGLGGGGLGQAGVEEAYRQGGRLVSGLTMEESGQAAWRMMGGAGGEEARLSRKEILGAVASILTARRNVALSILANQGVTASLQASLSFLLYTFAVFGCLSIWKIADVTGGGLDFFKTYVLAFSFIFGDTVKLVFQSAVYLLAEHPFDVGDWISLNSRTWRVSGYDLMYTTLKEFGGDVMVIPNSTLINGQVINLSRTGGHLDHLTVAVPLAPSTSPSGAQALAATLAAALNATVASHRSEYVEKSIVVTVTEVPNNQNVTLMASWMTAFSPRDVARTRRARHIMCSDAADALAAAGIHNAPTAMYHNILSWGGTDPLKVKNE